MRLTTLVPGVMVACAMTFAPAVNAANAPDWVRAQVSAPVPAHDDETDAVLLYSETTLTVLAPGRMKKLERRVFKILRADGEGYGVVHADFSPQSRVTAMRGWAIPTVGKDFETKDRDIIETALTDIDGGELISDIRRKVLRIPAAVPGNIVGYEYEQEMLPYEMTDEWYFQETVPVREARYTGEYATGLVPQDLLAQSCRDRADGSVAGAMAVVSLQPRSRADRAPDATLAGHCRTHGVVFAATRRHGGGFQSWQDVGTWYQGLTSGRRDPSAQLRQKAQELTASATAPLGKMQALAAYVQKDIRYVAIELGVGGVQPHPASEVLAHGYGDCKDKVTLLSSMLKEIGIESYYVLINTERGSITAATPPNAGFNHAVIAIKLPAGVDASQLPAVFAHKSLGPLLFFDPTHPLIPLGNLPGALQANYGMVVTPAGGELIALPQTASALNGLQRTAKMSLGEDGTLQGEVNETWSGDAAASQRYALRTAQQDVDQIKPVESMLTESLSTFQILNASVGNVRVLDRPLIWNYKLEIPRYPKTAGDLLIIRPRVFGSVSSGLLRDQEVATASHRIPGARAQHDEFEITVPHGYTVDSLPPAANEDLGFIAYRSSTTFSGNVLRYTRTLEVKQLSVPAAKADQLKKFFRVIEGDERNPAVLKKVQ